MTTLKMVPGSWIWIGLALVLSTGILQAGTSEGRKFHYKAGVIYAYEYVINGTTAIEGGPSQESGLHLSAKVAIKFLTACDAVLVIREVQAWDSDGRTGEHVFRRRDGGEAFSGGLSQFPLRFSYADGVIEEICPDPAESTWVLNIKRGLLSAFQNTMRRLDLEHKGEEDDVHGRCKTEYRLGVATSSTLNIERSKDIGSCGDKFGILSAVQGTPYHFGTLHQSMPAVSSSSECRHVVDSNLVAGIRCSEVHRLESLARGTGGAYTRISQALSLASVYGPDGEEAPNIEAVSSALSPLFAHLITTDQSDVFKRDSLQFRHDLRLAPAPNHMGTARAALQLFCSSMKEEVSGSSGESFEALVEALRGLSLEDMTSLSAEAETICDGDGTLFDDALEAVGTAASVGLMKDRILNGTAPPSTIESWISSLTFLPKPDLDTMKAAVQMLRTPVRSTYPSILLSYSALAHTYCRTRPSCARDSPISILAKLYTKYFSIQVPGCTTKTPKDVGQVLMYLKGIGNFGFFSPGINEALQKCILRNDATEVRVAAIEAYRRMTCSAEVNILRELFESLDEDSEVRIASFIGLMRCPTYLTIRSIKEALEREEVNQVGSFVWSYLKNLQETALPSKAELQGLVADEKLSKKFSTDFRKFSRNLEISSFYDDFNLGIGLDSNLIFSQKSYLPRSAMLNVTVDLFGESINVLEASFRLENYEHYVESLFGPDGKYRSKELHSIISSFREKRAVPSKRRLRALTLEYDAMRRYRADPIASMSLKTFGHEVYYGRKVGVDENADLLDTINPFQYLKQLAGQDSKWQKSRMLLDSSYVIPTGVGLPLNLSAQASTLVKMETSSVVDTSNFMASSEVKLQGTLKPSALVTVTGSMIFGTPEIQTGIKLKAHLRSSTAVEGNFHMKGSNLISAEFGLPKTSLELLDYKSDILFLEGEGFVPVGSVPGRPPTCSSGLLETLFGLQACRSSYFSLSPGSEVERPEAPYFPLNGPARLVLSLDKARPDLESTKVFYESVQDEGKTRLTATYEIKGKESREVLGLTFHMNKDNNTFEMGLKVPGKELRATGRLEDSQGSLNLTALSNDVQILAAQLSVLRAEGPGNPFTVRPSLLVTAYNKRVLEAKGDLTIVGYGGESGLSFDGTGVVELEDSGLSPLSLGLRGSYNDSRSTLGLDAEYRGGESGSRETIRWKSALGLDPRSGGTDEAPGLGIDTTLSLDFSEFPDYNLGASWKYQRNETGLESETEVRIGKGPAWSDLSALKIRHRLSVLESHEERGWTWLFWVSQPSRQSDWGLEAALNARGKSLESAINLQYAPGKNLQSSLSLRRAPGVLTLFQIGWNITLPHQHPFQIGIHLEETTRRVYQGKLETAWDGQTGLRIDMDYMDRTRRQKLVDKELKLAIQTSSLSLLRLRTHVYSDERESKLILSSDYEDRLSSWELAHSQLGRGKGHKVYTGLKHGPSAYSVTSQVLTENGLELFVTTDLGSKFPDLYLGFRAKETLGVYVLGLNYKWDLGRDSAKAFNFGYSLDLASGSQQRSDFALTYPGRNMVAFGEHRHHVGQGRSLKAQFSLDDKPEFLLDAHLTNVPDSPTSYHLKVESQTPWKTIQNASLDAKLNCGSEGDCLIKVDGSWGRRGRVSGVITSSLLVLPPEPGPGSAEDEPVNDESEEEAGDLIKSSEGKRRVEAGGLTLSLSGNLTSSLGGWEVVGISMQHTARGPLHLKTDIDIQLPEGKEVSLRNQWDLPRSLAEVWSTRVHLQLKTPFPEYQNFDFQTVLGQQEDSDTLGSVGLYADGFQYSLTVTGTPRFGEDGALGFEIITSHAKYDKIFGSLSYGIGESSRLACQLGWPGVVVGLETGYEWTGSWEDFHLYYSFNSPWKPLKNINTMLRIDSSQAELKFLLNEEGVTGKTGWVIESWDNFDVRFDGTSPLPDFRRLGLILKHSFEEEETYYSQVSGWVNDDQIGYKFEGGKSLVDDGENVASISNSQLEIDTIVYPTIRSTFSLAQRESKFNLGLSLLLREGPINVSAELHLLDLFRFNEKITITTPYPGLFELEINLSPAIMPESELYNLGLSTRWRGRSDWQEAGLIVRVGDQDGLSKALTTDLVNNMDYPEGDEEGEEEPTTPAPVAVPLSQLFHFNSPISWLRVLKFEMERIGGAPKGSGEEDEGAGDDEEGEETVATPFNFNIRKLEIIYSGVPAELSTFLENEADLKVVRGRVEVRELLDPISVGFEGRLDLSNPEKKFSLSASSALPKLSELNLETGWEVRADFVNVRLDLRTPFPAWEDQRASGMWAVSRPNALHTLDLDLFSGEHGRIGTNLVAGPGTLTLILLSPLHGFGELELSTTTSPLEDEDGKFATVLTIKKEKEEVLHMDVESLVEKGWPTQMKGTITSSVRGYGQGNLEGMMKTSEDEVNANGQIEWGTEKLRLALQLKLPGNRFQELDLKVDTPFKDFQAWTLWLKRQGSPKNQVDLEEEEEEELAEDDYDGTGDDDDEEPLTLQEDSMSLEYRASTPWPPLSTIQGTATIALLRGSSLFPVRGLTLTGLAPNGTLDLDSGWSLSSWNNFQFHCDSKYELSLSQSHPDLPPSNFLKLKLSNIIPTLDVLTSLESVIQLETRVPAVRLGGAAWVEHKSRESLTLRLSSPSPASLLLKADFDEDLAHVNANLSIALGPNTQNLTSALRVTRGAGSLEGDAEAEWGRSEFAALQSKFNCSYFGGERLDFHVDLFQPQRPNSTLPIGSIDGSFQAGSGSSSQAGQKTLLVDSVLNLTSVHSQLRSAGLRLLASIEGTTYAGQGGGHWDDEKAAVSYSVDLTAPTSSTRRLNGTLGLQLPFPGPQEGLIHCFLEENPTSLEGKLLLNFDTVKYLDTVYKQSSQSSGGRDEEYTKLEVDNLVFPLGLTRTYKYDYSGGHAGLNLPTKTVRLVEVYDLVHRDLHKLGGELRIHTNFNGREITLTGIHPSRRLALSTNYEHLDHQFKQNTSLSWNPGSWMGYELDIRNLTNVDKFEQQVGLKLSYPARLITVDSGLVAQGNGLKLTTDLNLNARKSQRKLSGIFNWDLEVRSPQLTVRRASVIIRHPSLTQEIRGGAELRHTSGESVEGKLSLDYSGDPKRRLTLGLKSARGQALEGHLLGWNLTTDLRLQHTETNLDLQASHSSRHTPHELSIITLIDFKNSGKVGKESKIAFELFKELKKVQIMMSSPEDHLVVTGRFQPKYHPVYYLSAEANISGIYPVPKATLVLDTQRPYFKMHALHGKDLTDGLYWEGGVIDARNFKVDFEESYDNFRFSDLNFFLRMNHSRLVTSKLGWRPELLEELEESWAERKSELAGVWSHQSDKLLLTLSADSAEVINQVWEDAKTTIEPFIKEIREACNFSRDSAALHEFYEESLARNDFYMQDITGFAQVFADRVSVRFSNIFIKIREYRRDLVGDSSTSELFEKALLWFLEKIKDQYRAVANSWDKYKIKIDTSGFTPDFSASFSGLSDHLADILHEAVDLLTKLSEELADQLSGVSRYVGSHFVHWVEMYKPRIFGVIHQVEVYLHSTVVKISDNMYETRDEVMRSAYYRKLAQLAEDVDQLYKDLLQNDAATNIRKYYSMLINFLRKKLTDFDEYQVQFGKLGAKFGSVWDRFKKLGFVQDIRGGFGEFSGKVKWLVGYLNLENLVQDIFVTLYTKGPDLMSQTVLEANSRYQQAKTRFIFDADRGLMEWEQKLPMPWTAFNEQPVFSELPEYKGIVKLQELFDSSSESSWDSYVIPAKKQRTNLIDWIPPFDGHAMVVGSDHFFTFDGRAYNFSGSCAYLLAGDLVDSNFTVSIEYRLMGDGSRGHSILVAAGHNTLIVDFENQTLRDPKRPQNAGLPIQLLHLQGYQDGGSLVVENPKKDFLLSCSMASRICQLRVSGWYSRKIGGLLGTMDHEPRTDLIHSNGRVASDIRDMAKSWDVSDDSPEPACLPPDAISTHSVPQTDPRTAATCNKLFRNRLSSLQPCFSTVKVDPYLELCLSGSLGQNGTSGPCVPASAYVSSCQRSGVGLVMPSICVKCDLNGEEMIDRDVRVMDSASSPRSTDIVLIVEAKDCNKNMRARKKIDTLLATLDKELDRARFSQNRYAVVAFGGDGVYDQPTAVSFRNQIFTNSSQIGEYLSHIHTGKGSDDIFGAIAYSLKLGFRPGVSKTFILFPCTSCQPQQMTMDFSTIHYSLLEQDATLHILMNKPKLIKNFFGMDRTVAFTKVDGSREGPIRGNGNLRRQVKLSRSTLGYCGPLALETNGTIFNGQKLQNKKAQIVNAFSKVFSRRVIQTAEPPACQSCYCSPEGRVNCFLCNYTPPLPYAPEADFGRETEEAEEPEIKGTPGGRSGPGNQGTADEDEEEGLSEEELDYEEQPELDR